MITQMPVTNSNRYFLLKLLRGITYYVVAGRPRSGALRQRVGARRITEKKFVLALRS